MTSTLARTRHKLAQVIHLSHIPSHHIRTEMHFGDLQIHIAAENFIQEEIDLHNSLFQCATRPQVFGGTAYHRHAVEPTTRDAEVDEVRGEQPAPLPTTGTMRIHLEMSSLKDPGHHHRTLYLNGSLFPRIKPFNEPRRKVPLERMAVLIGVVHIEHQGIDPTSNKVHC